jgi:hypothetical protein
MIKGEAVIHGETLWSPLFKVDIRFVGGKAKVKAVEQKGKISVENSGQL